MVRMQGELFRRKMQMAVRQLAGPVRTVPRRFAAYRPLGCVRAMKLACILLAHRSPQQLAQLLSVLRHPDVRFYLHVDSRVSQPPFTRALADLKLPGVVPLRRRPSRWGGIEMVDASLDGLARGAADGCDYFFLLSGQDFPLRPVEQLLSFVEHAADRSYIKYWPLPAPFWRFGGRDRTDFYTYTILDRRETCIPFGGDVSFFNRRGRTLNWLLRGRTLLKPSRRFPPYARPVGGSQWWNLSRGAARHVLDFVHRHPDYRRYHEYTLCPDEIFFHSILLGTDFADRHEVVNDNLRFTIWPPTERHPHVLTSADLPEILASDSLFARKFDQDVDPTALARLAESVAA
jgi:hypothetical protein